MAQSSAKNLLFATIFSPNYKKQLDFSGYARSLSSYNSEGAFDILPLHENFVTILRGSITIIDESGVKREFKVGQALVEASNNLVKVFVDF